MNEILLIILAMVKIGIFFIGGLLGIVLILLSIQLISYRVFNFNIYKKLINKIFIR